MIAIQYQKCLLITIRVWVYVVFVFVVNFLLVDPSFFSSELLKSYLTNSSEILPQ